VRIRRNARVGERAVIVAHAGVEIGESAVIGAWAAIEDARPTYADAETPIRKQPLAARPLSVGAGARIGAHASIHASVPAGAEIAPYAVVRDATSES
jgi:acetyltransferase-like isoleucine patch superfamily enzyme